MTKKNNKKVQRPIWFNQDQIDLYNELVKKKVISKSFPQFVKGAFHEKIDEIRKGD